MSEINSFSTVDAIPSLTSQLLELQIANQNLQDISVRLVANNADLRQKHQDVLQANAWLAGQLNDLTQASARLAACADDVIQDNARLQQRVKAAHERTIQRHRSAEAEGRRLRDRLWETVKKVRIARAAETATIADRDHFECLWIEEREARADLEAECKKLRDEKNKLLEAAAEKEMETQTSTAQDEMPKLKEE